MKYLVLIAIVALAACKTRQSEQACDADFDTFFRKFGSDSIYQKQHIAFPLLSQTQDEDFTHLVDGHIEAKNYYFRDFTRDNDSYQLEIVKKKDSAYYTQMGVEGNSATTYSFANKNNCWTLVAVRDITE